jgi:hypothetical protein
VTRSRRELFDAGALERYIRSAILPRYMVRLRQIEDDLAHTRAMVERAYLELRAACADDPELFARRWRETAESWRFDELNELIRQHNEYYPIERNLPVDPKTGDYVTIIGRSHRRELLDADWILERFPARRPA